MEQARFRLRELLRPYYLRWLYFRLIPGARPQEFEQCWRYPSRPLQPSSLVETGAHSTAAPAFLFYPMADIHARVQRTRHFTRVLAELLHPSFVLNPHLGRQFASLYRTDPAPRLNTLGPNQAELHVRLPAEPVYHARLLDSGEDHILSDSIAPLDSRFGENVIQMVSLPTWLGAAALLKRRFGWPIVYDCHDLISGFPRIAAEIVEAEYQLLDQADFVFFSSQYLLEDAATRVPTVLNKCAALRNAVDVEHFAGPHRSNGGTRIVGYVGALDEWFDIQSVRVCAMRFPELQFTLIGRVEHAPVRELRRLPNVELCGEIPYAELPERMSRFDAALIPFRITPLTLATNPIKLYEYFGLGLPVVSTALPEVAMFEDLVYLAGGPEGFAGALASALEEPEDGRRSRRIAIAAKETWNQRGLEILESISHLAASASGSALKARAARAV